MRLYEDDILLKPAILDYLSISSWTFDRILALWNATGEVVRETNGVRGRPRILHFSDVEYLKRLIRHPQTGSLTSFSICFRLTALFLRTSLLSTGNSFAGISEKKIKKVASERNEDLRADFIAWMGQYSPEQLGFLDEVLKDERTSFWTRGRSRKGTRAVMKGVFVRGRCFSAKGLLSIDGMVTCSCYPQAFKLGFSPLYMINVYGTNPTTQKTE